MAMTANQLVITPEKRQAFKKAILRGMATILSTKEYSRAETLLANMPDDKFDLMADYLRRDILSKGFNAKAMVLETEAYRQRFGITRENSALNCVSLDFQPDEVSNEIWKRICQSKPSDRIRFNSEDDTAICDFWKKFCSREMLEKGGIPSDLFFAGKIPLMDCEIAVDESDLPNGSLFTYRVVIFSDYTERLKNSGDEPVYVGAIVFNVFGMTCFQPIIVIAGVDRTLMGNCGLIGKDKENFIKRTRGMTQQMLVEWSYSCMNTWYGIQLALLHPTVKQVFAHPKTEPVMESKPRKGGKKRRFVRYIKNHVITADNLAQAAKSPVQSSGFTRHTPIWYVIGHWRHYADGRKVFIKPYWKGEMRHLRMDLDGREREIVIEEGGIN